MTVRARRLLQLGALVLLAALGVGLGLALWHEPAGGRIDLGGRPIVVRQELSPAEPQFGDTVVATTGVFAAKRIDPGSVRVRADFAPYELASTARDVDKLGDVSVVRVVSHLRCLDVGCVPHGTLRTFRFKPLQISYGSGSVTKRWPALRVHSRLTKADSARPVVRVPPPIATGAHYRVSPTVLGVAPLVLAALLAAGGVALLLGVGLRRIVPARPRVPPLERVLAELAASCSNGDSGHKRRALDALARELEPLDESLSAESRVLAWGPGEPQAAAISDLTERVKTAVKT